MPYTLQNKFYFFQNGTCGLPKSFSFSLPFLKARAIKQINETIKQGITNPEFLNIKIDITETMSNINITLTNLLSSAFLLKS